ncbi:helix-turn-helix transcriptional regulator [Ralstonia solanacearum]|uniref:winged helix-turn-helix transcriptional regulator n=1 Tax=Ralstonia pseudosolanacearum TaxID=1310165 RepID=UPI000B771A43|nr:helix-turn-helix transcriptional regulator [Ralstonia pseudosolanacearum]QIK24173.1 helix-turn-helix transcriptional regulator [Ralstonia solanacearum]QIK27791.1 helix-turn-helix transcriptional regulator [Ralstonia solanacearum]QIK32696.1 helix-turn-helix transcriptional regulator [Ralstonia solanacearum]
MLCTSYVKCTIGETLNTERKKTPCCGVARFLTLLDGPWATLIVRELLHGPQRFTQLREALPGISAHTLTHRLKGFERHGLVTRTAYAETPPRVVYALTPLGEGLRDVLKAMRKWGDSVPEEVTAEEAVQDAADAAEFGMPPECPFSQLSKGRLRRSR